MQSMPDSSNKTVYNQSDYFNFTRYIIANCWKKMYWHIFHLLSISFVGHLLWVHGKYLWHTFTDYASSIKISKHSDAALVRLLVGMDRDRTIKSLIMDLCKNPELHSKLPHLTSTFNEVVRKGEMKECNAEEQLGIDMSTMSIWSEYDQYKHHR